MAENNNHIWHPFTQMKTAPLPIHIERAKGCILYDDKGNEYVDAISSWWVNILGHANGYIAETIADQAKTLEHVIFAGFTHTPAQQLAKNLINILPDNFTKVFYSDNGSTSVEVAIKMSLQYWYNQNIKTKTKIIAFENAYHGDTFGAMSVGARSVFSAPFDNHLFEVIHIPLPTAENIFEVGTQLYELISKNDVAAFIFEPLVQGAGGMLMYEAEHLDTLVSIAQQNNVLCIADEVMTGFGRTGKTFAIDYLQHKPDIVCLSKGITGGFMPLGVTACSQKIFDAFYDDDKTKTFYHGHSYTANPLSCAAANATLHLLLSREYQERIFLIGELHKMFALQLAENDFVKNIRQKGTILAFDLNTDEKTSYFNSIRDEAYKYYMDNGVLLRPLGNTIYIMLPYCVTQPELEKVYNTILSSLPYLKSRLT